MFYNVSNTKEILNSMFKIQLTKTTTEFSMLLKAVVLLMVTTNNTNNT